MSEKNNEPLANFSLVLKSKQNRSLLEGALTHGLDMSRFIKCAWIQAQTNDDVNALAQKNPTSVFRAMLQLAQMGLYADGEEAYLAVFGSKCVAMRGYKGLMKIFSSTRNAAMNPWVVDVIRKKDHWHLSMGGTPKLIHEPAKSDRGDITHYYAVARFADGSEMPKVMDVDEVEAFKAYAKTMAFWDSPHEPTREAMRKKTVVRQLCKMLPLAESVTRSGATVGEEALEAGVIDASEYLGNDGDSHIEGGEIKKTQALPSADERDAVAADAVAADAVAAAIEVRVESEPVQISGESVDDEPPPGEAYGDEGHGNADPFTADKFPE